MKTNTCIIPLLSCLLFGACAPQTVYVPVPVPPEEKPTATTRTTTKPKTPTRPVETPESFRAVERPTTYSN